MKLYVIPVERACNAKCPYCITGFRDFKNSYLSLADLHEVLLKNRYEKIEITGGGEPSLHPGIDKLIEVCASYCPTQIYTNGTLDIKELPKNLMMICLSRAHYDDEENQKIMGVNYDINKYKGLPLKLSLMLHNSGIKNEEGVLEYLNWAKDRATKVVIRQLFEYEDPEYIEYYKKEYVPTFGLFENSNFEIERLESGNRQFKYKGMDVEIEERACACDNENPVLHATGKLSIWETV